MSKGLTEHQQEVLETIPDGWFYPEDLPGYIHDRRSVCSKLKDKGCLESKAEITGWDVKIRYRLREDKTMVEGKE